MEGDEGEVGARLARRMAPVVSAWGVGEGAESGAAVVLWGGDVLGSGLACLAGAAEHGRDGGAGRTLERWRAPVEPRVKGEGGCCPGLVPLVVEGVVPRAVVVVRSG